MMKAKVSLFAVVTIAVLIIVTLSPEVCAQSAADSWYSDGPTVTFYAKNSTMSDEWIELTSDNLIYSDTANVTLRIHVSGPSRVANSVLESQGCIIRWSMGYLTSVSYKAGWQNYKNVYVYYSDTSNDGEKTLDFELTNIPNFGKHNLIVETSCVVYEFSGGTLTPLYFSHSDNLDFTVASNPTPTPLATPTNTPSLLSANFVLTVVIPFSIVASVVLLFSIWFFRKHRKTINVKQ